MLTSDLVRVHSRGGKIRPRYVDPGDDELLALAGSLIETFEAHRGHPRHELEAELGEILGTGTAFQLHRGLAKLLFDRCELDVEAGADPEELRARVFRLAAEAHRGSGEEGAPSRGFDRAAVVKAACAEAGLEPERFDRALYADLKDQQVLTEFRACDPPWLLRRYNCALAQAVLLRARRLEIRIAGETPARYRALFRKIKFFRLLHRVKGNARKGYRIVLDGPLSLFQSSQRYGLQMATFLPSLLHFQGWTLKADLAWGRQRQARIFHLASDDGLRSHTRLTGQWQPEELAWLADQVEEKSDAWRASTDGELIDLGGQGVLVPDFVFEHRLTGRRIPMEVFGYWNRGAVESRLEVLRRHGPTDLILAISKALVGDPESLRDLPAEVYFFRRTPLAREVLALLESKLVEG